MQTSYESLVAIRTVLEKKQDSDACRRIILVQNAVFMVLEILQIILANPQLVPLFQLGLDISSIVLDIILVMEDILKQGGTPSQNTNVSLGNLVQLVYDIHTFVETNSHANLFTRFPNESDRSKMANMHASMCSVAASFYPESTPPSTVDYDKYLSRTYRRQKQGYTLWSRLFPKKRTWSFSSEDSDELPHRPIFAWGSSS